MSIRIWILGNEVQKQLTELTEPIELCEEMNVECPNQRTNIKLNLIRATSRKTGKLKQ